MLTPDFTASFARDRKRCAKKHWNLAQLAAAIQVIITSDEELPPTTYHDHALTADMWGYRALHVGGPRSNWLIIYMIDGERVVFTRTGTHDEVFRS
jgi:mRNA interferase YafQ